MNESPILWQPPAEWQKTAHLTRFMRWLEERGHTFSDYHTLWEWSTTALQDFWQAVWDYFALPGRGTGPVLDSRTMPGARWFPGAEVNYAAELFRSFKTPDPVMLVGANEQGSRREWTRTEVESRVGALQALLTRWGLEPGDRVAAYLPNLPETVIAFMAVAGLGAVWSVCSPDFGLPSVVDRFRQIEPKVLLAIDGYWYNGKWYDRRAEVVRIKEALPTVERVITLGYDDMEANWIGQGAVSWWQAVADPQPPVFQPVEFSHPLWILYSSGTTGLPKPIVHSHGGMLLSHLVNGYFHMNLMPGDRFFWYTTTGWMMWNVVVSALLTGATSYLFDGNPMYPGPDALWQWAWEERLTHFGTSAAFIHQSMKAGVVPQSLGDYGDLKSVASTGSPLTPEAFEWVYRTVKSDVWLAPASGGTDICGPFVGGCPLLPVRLGEMQCRVLGAKVEAFDEVGRSLVNQVGELVVTAPMPSMPIYLWGDRDMSRYRDAYFSMYPGVWRHGDWIRITPSGGAVIYGRSDSTINRYGVRMGSSEIYRAVESVPAVEDSLVVDLEGLEGRSFMPLFVKLVPGAVLDEALVAAIKNAIRTRLSPRHVPDVIRAVPDIPKTLNGKKLEVPIRKILQGVPLEKAVNPDAMANPDSLKPFVDYAHELPQAGILQRGATT